jgi:hypothetical protein
MENPYIRYPHETFPERLLKLALLFGKIQHLDDETVKVIMADPSLLKTEHLRQEDSSDIAV